MRSDPRMRSDPKPKTDPFYLKTADGTPIVPLRQKVSDNNPFSAQMPTSLMRRPKFNTAGKATPISINSHRVLNFPKKPVYQYDVSHDRNGACSERDLICRFPTRYKSEMAPRSAPSSRLFGTPKLSRVSSEADGSLTGTNLLGNTLISSLPNFQILTIPGPREIWEMMFLAA